VCRREARVCELFIFLICRLPSSWESLHSPFDRLGANGGIIEVSDVESSGAG
jgi:hypothetical protein